MKRIISGILHISALLLTLAPVALMMMAEFSSFSKTAVVLACSAPLPDPYYEPQPAPTMDIYWGGTAITHKTVNIPYNPSFNPQYDMLSRYGGFSGTSLYSNPNADQDTMHYWDDSPGAKCWKVTLIADWNWVNRNGVFQDVNTPAAGTYTAGIFYQDFTNPQETGTDDGAYTASGTVNLVKAVMNLSGNETYNGLRVIQATLPAGPSGSAPPQLTANVQITPSSVPITNIQWTCSSNMIISESYSTSYSNPAATSVTILPLGPGPGTVYCSVSFEEYSWLTGHVISVSASDSVTIYRATIALFADSGGASQGDSDDVKISVGHSWWDLEFSAGNDALLSSLIPNSANRNAIGVYGYGPEDGWDITPTHYNAPGQVAPGSMGHVASGSAQWGISISNLNSALSCVAGLKQQPGEYNLYTNNCTTNAVAVGGAAGVSPPGAVSPSVLSDWLITQ